jgi:hypothetical protein
MNYSFLVKSSDFITNNIVPGQLLKFSEESWNNSEKNYIGNNSNNTYTKQIGVDFDLFKSMLYTTRFIYLNLKDKKELILFFSSMIETQTTDARSYFIHDLTIENKTLSYSPYYTKSDLLKALNKLEHKNYAIIGTFVKKLYFFMGNIELVYELTELVPLTHNFVVIDDAPKYLSIPLFFEIL